MTDYSNSDITVPDMFILYCVFFYHILYPINRYLKKYFKLMCKLNSFFELNICYKINFMFFLLPGKQ